jgi:hypothetical protein
MRIEIPVSALARFVAGRQRIGNHLAQAARPEGDRPPAGNGRRQDVGPDHDLRGRLVWNSGRRVASPATATTDFLAPDILNKCGRAVPPEVSASKGPGRPIAGIRGKNLILR